MLDKLISIIIPAYNEEQNIPVIYDQLKNILSRINFNYELIFINDGSQDNSEKELKKLMLIDPQVKVIEFSRNFGKEIATTAGINNCRGECCITIDADLQHPPELIFDFLAKWKKGAEIVIGVRQNNKSESFIKKIGSFCFYKIIGRISEIEMVPYATDFRLLDKKVINEFNRFTEKNRLTRGLIDWLGFKREYIHFEADKRLNGKATYSTVKLIRLALNSVVSLSLFPLKLAGYLGIFITIAAGLLGLFVIIEKYVLKDVWRFNFSGPAILAIIILFLVGIILICLGLIALYIANIHKEAINRPIYVIREKNF
ncbi:MAG: glycosyltransferase family 2 protein [Candidatus Parcubacteria bacterium]|nr:glycosyltransferase family 2 protein [Candidatus Parcubacteria bacterium]